MRAQAHTHTHTNTHTHTHTHTHTGNLGAVVANLQELDDNMRAAHKRTEGSTERGDAARDGASAGGDEVQGGVSGGALQGVEGHDVEHRAVFSFVVCTQVS